VSATRCKIALLLLCGLLVGFEWEGRLSHLRRDLDEGDAARRREVVRLLSSYAAPVVRDALLQALSDPDAGVRAEAAEAVGRVRLEDAVPRLLDWLGDPDADVRTGAAVALGRIGAARAVPPLVRLLGDARSDVRRAAVGALAAIGAPEVVVPLLGRLDDADTDVRVEAAEALGRIGDPQAVVPLVGRLRDDAPEVRRAVYAALGRIGSPRAVAALQPGLRDPTPEVRLAAIGALGRIGQPDTAESLAPLAEDADHRVARAAVTALGSLGGATAVDAIIASVERRETRETATSILVRLASATPPGPEGSPHALVSRLSNAFDRATSDAHATALAEVLLRLAPVTSIEGAAPALLRGLSAGQGKAHTLLRALGATGSTRALVPLLEHVGSESGATQKAALDALDLLFERVPPDGRAADPLLSAVGHTGPSALPQLLRLLGRVRAARAVPTLRDLLSHKSPAVRLAAVEALGHIGDPQAASALMPLLDDPDGRTRFEAARALQSAASADTVRALLERVGSRAPHDRHAALVALGGALGRLHAAKGLPAPLPEQARRRLAPLLEARDLPLAARTIDTLGQWGDAANAPLLIHRAQTGPAPLRRHALRMLGALPGQPALEALRGALGSGDPSLQAAAAGALGEHGTAQDGPVLLEAIREGRWPVAASASFGLVRLLRRGEASDAVGPDGLCDLLAPTRDPYVRANLAVALAVQGGAACEGGPRRTGGWVPATPRWSASPRPVGSPPSPAPGGPPGLKSSSPDAPPRIRPPPWLPPAPSPHSPPSEPTRTCMLTPPMAPSCGRIGPWPFASRTGRRGSSAAT
jgi:cellulose synthase operon protein C